MCLSKPQSIVHGAHRSLALVALLVGLSVAVALHHGSMLDVGLDTDAHHGPMLVLCFGVAATAVLAGWAAPRAGPSWSLLVGQQTLTVGVPAVPVLSSARDGPAVLQVFLT